MTALVRWCTALWALAALVVLAFIDVPIARWLLVLPVLVFGPGVVAARFVSPDDARFRPTIALVAGLVTLVLVSQVFVLGDWLSTESMAAVLAALTVVGAVVVPERSAIATLPPRMPIDPRSPAATRLRAAPSGRTPIVVPQIAATAAAPAAPPDVEHGRESVYAIVSPTIGALAEVVR